MKTSIALSALILAAATGLGWLIDGRLDAARIEERKLATESVHLGIPLDDAPSLRTTRRERPNYDVEARRFAGEFIQLAKEIEQGGRTDVAAQEHFQDLYQQISSLHASQLKILIVELLTTKELGEKNRANRLVHALWAYADKDGQDALALFTRHIAILKDHPNGGDVVSASLGNWAKDAPLAAVEWMKKYAVEFPEALSGQSKSNVFGSVAKKDPRLALTLIARLGLNASDSDTAVHSIVMMATTDDERNITLAALREYREANKGDKSFTHAIDDRFGDFSYGFEKEGFAAATQWLASANLNQKELDRFCQKLSLNYDGDEPAQWIDWYIHHGPPGKSEDQISGWISTWTRNDFEAAGKWLASAADGPVKNAAICGYAETVFEHDPETAMQWIMTLPPSQRRQDTLQNILDNYLKDDPAGKEAFAKEHGIK